MNYIFPAKDFYTVPFEQMAHDFAMLKLTKQYQEGTIETYGDFFKLYVDELDTMKCYLKSIYGDDIFTS